MSTITCLRRCLLSATSVVVAFLAVSGVVPAQASGNLWFDKFVAYETAHGGDYYNSTDAGTLGWAESYMLRSYVTVYSLTKDTAWLDKFTTHVDAIIGHAADSDGDGFLDWKTASYGDGGSYPYLVFDGLVCLPIAQFIRLVNQNPTTLAAYATKAASYRTFIENEIVPKWVTSTSYVGNCWVQVDASTGYYREPTTHDTLTGAVFDPLPYNMMAPYAQMLFAMYDVNGNASYNTKANQIIRYFNLGFVTNGTGYTWNYCNIASPHTEDTSHGNLDVDMALDSFNRGAGSIISGAEIGRISETLTDNMWNQNLTTPKVKDKVDGTGTTYADTLLLTGWTRLTQFNATNWYIAANQFRSIAPTSFNHAHTVAQIMAWDPVKVQNQGFDLESFTDVTLPARWSRLGAAANVCLDATNKISGRYGVKVESLVGDALWQAFYQDWKEWKPSTTYVVTYDCKVSGTAGGRIFMYDTATSTVVGTVHDFNNTTWATGQTFTFITPASTSGTLRIYLENHDRDNAGTAWFDNVVIKQLGDTW